MGISQGTLRPEHLNGMTALGVQRRGDKLMILAEDPSGRTFGTVYLSIQPKAAHASTHGILRAFHPGGGVTTWREKRIGDLLAPLVPFELHYAGTGKGDVLQLGVLPILVGMEAYERAEGPCHCDSRREAEDLLLADIQESGGYRGTSSEFPGFVCTFTEEVTLKLHPVKLSSPLPTPLPKQLSTSELHIAPTLSIGAPGMKHAARRATGGTTSKDAMTPVPSSSSLTHMYPASEGRASSSSALIDAPSAAATPAGMSNSSFPRPSSDERVDTAAVAAAASTNARHPARTPLSQVNQLSAPGPASQVAISTPSPSFPTHATSTSCGADDRASSIDEAAERAARCVITVPCSVRNQGTTYYGVRCGGDRPMVWRSEKSLKHLKDLAVRELQRHPLGGQGERGTRNTILHSKHSNSGDSGASLDTSSPLASPRSEGVETVADSLASSLLCAASPLSSPWEDPKVLHAVLAADAHHPSGGNAPELELPLFLSLHSHQSGLQHAPSHSSSFSSSVFASPGDAKRSQRGAHRSTTPHDASSSKTLQAWSPSAVSAAKERVVESWLNALHRLDHPGVGLFLRLFLGGASSELTRSTDDGVTSAPELLFLNKRKIPRHVLARLARGAVSERERASSTCSKGSRSGTSEAGLSSARSQATSGRRVPHGLTPLTSLTCASYPTLSSDDLGLAMAGRRVVDVVRNSPAYAAGMRAGMVVHTVGGTVAWTGADVESAFAEFGSNTSKRTLPIVVGRLNGEASSSSLDAALMRPRPSDLSVTTTSTLRRGYHASTSTLSQQTPCPPLPTTPSPGHNQNASANATHSTGTAHYPHPHTHASAVASNHSVASTAQSQCVPPMIHVAGNTLHHPHLPAHRVDGSVRRGVYAHGGVGGAADGSGSSEDYEHALGQELYSSFDDIMDDDNANHSEERTHDEETRHAATPDDSDVPVEGSIALLRMLPAPLAELNGSVVRLVARAVNAQHWTVRLLTRQRGGAASPSSLRSLPRQGTSIEGPWDPAAPAAPRPEVLFPSYDADAATLIVGNEHLLVTFSAAPSGSFGVFRPQAIPPPPLGGAATGPTAGESGSSDEAASPRRREATVYLHRACSTTAFGVTVDGATGVIDDVTRDSLGARHGLAKGQRVVSVGFERSSPPARVKDTLENPAASALQLSLVVEIEVPL